jgi:hypothetical protein
VVDTTDEDDEVTADGIFKIHEEMLEDTSQSSESDIDSLNTGVSSQVQLTSSSFNLRLPWKHESVVMELLNYYTEQVS